MSGSSEAKQIHTLRSSLRDLLALTALPALWVGQSPESVLEGLVDAVARLLQADIVHARLGPRRQPLATPVTRTAHTGESAALDQALEGALRRWDTRPGAGPVSLLPDGPVTGVVRLAVWSLGADGGVLAVGTRRGDFPTEQECLLLGVAASQGAVALQNATLLAASRSARVTTDAASPSPAS